MGLTIPVQRSYQDINNIFMGTTFLFLVPFLIPDLVYAYTSDYSINFGYIP